MTRWYRAYEGTVSDPKLHEAAVVAGVSRSVAIAAWHAILEACAGARDGAQALSARRLAVILGETVDGLSSLLAAFDEVGLVVAGRVAAWDKRQYASDTSTDRVRRHRETRGNVDETFHERCETEVKRSASVSVSEEPTQESPSITEEAEPSPRARDVRPKQARSVRLPSEWGPSDRNLADADAAGLSGSETQHEAAKFRDWAHGKGVAKADWDATWRNWCRRVVEQRLSTGPPRPRLVSPPTIDQHGRPIHEPPYRTGNRAADYNADVLAGLLETDRSLHGRGRNADDR